MVADEACMNQLLEFLPTIGLNSEVLNSSVFEE